MSKYVDRTCQPSKLYQNLLNYPTRVLYLSQQFLNPQNIGDIGMDKYQDYTKEQLLEQIKILEKAIQVQHETINKMLDAYILKAN